MTLYDDLSGDLQKLIDHPARFNLLKHLDFKPRSNIIKIFPDEFQEVQTSTMQFLCIKYHGMGHYQIVTVDPTRAEKKFYLLVVGGSSDWQRADNDKERTQLNEDNFCDLDDLLLYAYGTHEAPIYENLKSVKNAVDTKDFVEFIFSSLEI